jgi:hypothetical protein
MCAKKYSNPTAKMAEYTKPILQHAYVIQNPSKLLFRAKFARKYHSNTSKMIAPDIQIPRVGLMSPQPGLRP